MDYRRCNRREGREKFERTRFGDYVYWGLRECVNSEDSPLDKDTGNNLSFLVELRNEIEHRVTPRLDDTLGGSSKSWESFMFIGGDSHILKEEALKLSHEKALEV